METRERAQSQMELTKDRREEIGRGRRPRGAIVTQHRLVRGIFIQRHLYPLLRRIRDGSMTFAIRTSKPQL